MITLTGMPDPTAPLVELVRRIHKEKTLRQHVMRVRAIREAVQRMKGKELQVEVVK